MFKIYLDDILGRTRFDSVGFIGECEQAYTVKIDSAADYIAAHMETNRVILISGPSASGKTTTSYRIERALREMGINTHTISIDDYFTENLPPQAFDSSGHKDFESPYCVDISLLNEHFRALTRGCEVLLPKFDFKMQARSDVFTPLRLKKNEVAIFEGIHALNDLVTGDIGDRAVRIYVRVRSEIFSDENTLFLPKNCARLARRILRDNMSRGVSAANTLDMWYNVRMGEHKYIVPFIDRSDFQIDTYLPYEACVIGPRLIKLLSQAGPDVHDHELSVLLYDKMKVFPELDGGLTPNDSIIREFIGGSIFEQEEL